MLMRKIRINDVRSAMIVITLQTFHFQVTFFVLGIITRVLLENEVC